MPAESSARLVPAAAVALAGGYLVAATLLPAVLPVIVVAAAIAACAAVLVRRPGGGLRRTLAVLTTWLAWGLAGAWWLRGAAIAGLGWVVVVLFLLPLPLIPWLYARTFAESARTGDPGKDA